MRKRVLIVEDDATFSYLLQRELRGVDTTVVTGSIAALDLIDRGESFDLYVLDIQLGRGEPHGYALGRMIALKAPAAQLLFMTGRDVGLDEIRAASGPVLEKAIGCAAIGSRARQLLAKG